MENSSIEFSKTFQLEEEVEFLLEQELCCFKESFIFSWWSILDVTELSYHKDAS